MATNDSVTNRYADNGTSDGGRRSAEYLGAANYRWIFVLGCSFYLLWLDQLRWYICRCANRPR